MATDSELRDIAADLRIRYWMTLGDRTHLDRDPSPESAAAWIEVARGAEAMVNELRDNRRVLDVALNLAAVLPIRGLPEGELRKALGNFRNHQQKSSRHHGALCSKCVRTASRLVSASCAPARADAAPESN